VSAKFPEMLKRTKKALSAGGAVFLSLANPVNLLFFALLVMAGFAMLNEQIILVGMISTLAMLTAALGAAVLAMIFVPAGKKLPSLGFKLFLAFAFVASLTIWAFEIFNTIPDNQWLHVAGLAAIMLICSFYLVPRLREVYRKAGVMA